MGEAHALRRRAGLLLQERHRHPIGHGVEHRDRKLGAFAGALARDQCFQDRFVGVHAGRDIDDGDADARRLGRAGDRGQTGFCLNEHVVGFAHGVRSALAEAGDRATNQPWMLAPQFGEGKAELAYGARLQILNEDVGTREHRTEQRLVARFGKIEHDRFLATVEPDEIAALAVHQIVVAAREVALRPLDLDDARAGVCQARRTHRRRDRLFERDDEEAGEGKGAAQYDLGKPSTCSAM